MRDRTCGYSGDTATGGYFAHRRKGEPACGGCLDRFTGYSNQRRAELGRRDQTFWIVCEFCTRRAEVSKRDARCCSQQCAQRLRAGWSASLALAVYVRSPEPSRPVVPPSSGRVFVAGTCRRCSAAFVIIDQLTSAYCSKACARSDGKDRRRASKRDAFVEPVYRRRIFDRDCWRCGICGKPTLKAAKVPHPRAPVLDHIVPLAAGGSHEPANVQCAHFLCNSVKGHRPAGDQLRLIG